MYIYFETILFEIQFLLKKSRRLTYLALKCKIYYFFRYRYRPVTIPLPFSIHRGPS
jgi:hypothetical protein